MVSPQARQRGGNTPSTMARPIRRKWLEAQLARVADACIDTHHQVVGTFVNPDQQLRRDDTIRRSPIVAVRSARPAVAPRSCGAARLCRIPTQRSRRSAYRTPRRRQTGVSSGARPRRAPRCVVTHTRLPTGDRVGHSRRPVLRLPGAAQRKPGRGRPRSPPVSRRQLRSRRQHTGIALGRRPARGPRPNPPYPQTGGPLSRGNVGRRHPRRA